MSDTDDSFGEKAYITVFPWSMCMLRVGITF